MTRAAHPQPQARKPAPVPLKVIRRTQQGARVELLIDAGSRRLWMRAARTSGGVFLAPRPHPVTTAVRELLRDGASLLEEHAVRRQTTALFRTLAAGKLPQGGPTRFVPGVLVEVVSTNSDGSAGVTRLSTERGSRL